MKRESIWASQLSALSSQPASLLACTVADDTDSHVETHKNSTEEETTEHETQGFGYVSHHVNELLPPQRHGSRTNSEIWTTLQHTSLSSPISFFNNTQLECHKWAASSSAIVTCCSDRLCYFDLNLEQVLKSAITWTGWDMFSAKW